MRNKDRLEPVSEDNPKQGEIYEWRLSQSAWHRAQAKPLKDGKVRRWHHRQARIYGAGVSFSWVVSKTLQKYSATIAANVSGTNALFRRMYPKNFK